MEDAFVQKREVVEAHLDDLDFSVEASREVFLSCTQVHCKAESPDYQST